MKKNPHAVSLGRRGGLESARVRSRGKGGLKHWGLKAARSRWGYSLAAFVEEIIREPDEWRVLLKEFFREAALRPKTSLLSRKPRLMGDPGRDAYVAVLGEEIARTYNYKVPEWVYDKDRYCPYPYFGAALEGMKPYLIQNTSSPFRRRNLFMDPDEISRALAKARSEVAT